MAIASTTKSSAQACLDMDTETTVRACLDFAVQLSRRDNNPISRHNKVVGTGNNNDDKNKFRLEPAAFSSLLQRLETNPRVSLEHFHVEYDPETRLACFKMPQGRLHAAVAQYFGDIVTDAARTALPRAKQFYEWRSDFFPPRSESDSLDNGSGSPGALLHPLSYVPDVSYYLPRVVSEVAYSSPSTLEELEAKCAQYISYTHGYVRAAIAVKIPYDRQNPRDFAGILDRLDDCLVAVWEWDAQNERVRCAMSWASVTQQDATITLRPWHFSDNMTTGVTAVPVSNKRHGKGRGRKGGRRAARPKYICVPFAEIRRILRESIEIAARAP
ncbi:hypothetical protein ColTof4_13584 [Colletotrichum tofieldiae]|nr:hypothetical protein ColTof3_14533 [Colletotrichum tofieldiae]GKT81161.1 hypothetical protein ColTof4_13584 [Colletotrichum tofieldiae]